MDLQSESSSATIIESESCGDEGHAGGGGGGGGAWKL